MNKNTLSRLSVDLPYEIYKQLKLKAVLTDQSMREVITKLVKDFLKE